jgi:PAS domain S-box-containing protein
LSDKARESDSAGQLAGHEDAIRLLVDSVSDYAIFLLDREGNVATWNKGAQRFKGYEAHEIIGRHFSNFYSDADNETGKPAMELEIATRDGRVEDEGWRVRKDGTRFWANVVITALRNKEGELIGFGKVTRDLTQRKQAEDALRMALGREEEAARQLRELDEMKNEFVAMVAHDLRSPMAVMSGFAGMLTTRWNDISDEQKLDLVGRIEKATARLTRLVNDVLDVSRIEAGVLQYDRKAFDLSDLINRAILEGVSDEDRERVMVAAATNVPLVLGDEQRIWQVFLNLLSNALKFSPTDSRVLIRIEPADEVCRVEVRDEGPGIDPEFHERVFDRFSKIPGSEESKGTGLGLYIARSMIEAQGGRLEVESTPGEGAVFTFTLPLAS